MVSTLVRSARATGSRARVWYMHEVLCAVRDALSNTCHGTGGPTAWPPRSTPHLNPWGHLNAAPVDNEETHRTVDVCQTIRNYRGIF
jgi:hypothetical protein